jgi:hypothetical protein
MLRPFLRKSRTGLLNQLAITDLTLPDIGNDLPENCNPRLEEEKLEAKMMKF